MYYSLEFSEKQNCFHYQNPTNQNKNTNGFYCICEFLHLKYCDEFTQYINKKYKNPSLGIVKLEFDFFFLWNKKIPTL